MTTSGQAAVKDSDSDANALTGGQIVRRFQHLSGSY